MSLKDSYKIMELEERIKVLEDKVELIFGNSSDFQDAGVIDLIENKKVTRGKKRESKK
tara:strand:+ start:164 stop:337 length:174 start_codon:yes stop_codon:yes gene_type:complete